MEKIIKKIKSGNPGRTLVLALLLAVALPFLTAVLGLNAGTTETRAANNVLVRFWDSDGRTNYPNLRVKVEQGKTFKIPEVPAVAGYKSLGWAQEKNASQVNFLPGRSVVVKNNVNLYAVRSKIEYVQASFYTNTGKTNAKYKKLAITAEKGAALTLPALPTVKGYQPVGWATAKKATKAKYKAGTKVSLSKNKKFYAVYKKSKYYALTFYNQNGKTSTAFKKLKKSVEQNTYAKLPAVPTKSGYVALGWAKTKNSTAANYKAGGKLKINKATKLYAVYKKAATVSLFQQDGTTLYKRYSIELGTYYELPSVSNTSVSVFLGWDTQPRKSTAPNWQAKDKIQINGNVNLYAVRCKREEEPQLSEADLAQSSGWRQKYRQVVFVGDSRTVRMSKALQVQFGAGSEILQGITFLAEEGKGLDWLKETGYPQLLNIVGSDTAAQEQTAGDPKLNAQKPTAVIFNLGVNDLTRSAEYLSYLESIATELKTRNCRLYFMSVNPVGSATMKAFDKVNPTNYSKSGKRNEAAVRAFNQVLRNSLRSYTYIDSYNYLMQTGFATNPAKEGVDLTTDDGLHYATKTSKRIFKFCLDALVG